MAWLDLVDKSELKYIPIKNLISDNGISIVCKNDGNPGVVFKRSIPFLIENELWCLERMQESGLVPNAFRWDKYTIAMDYIERQPITDKDEFMSYKNAMLDALYNANIRHGDFTKYAVIPNNNKPYVIDFAESRQGYDPRPDKRPEGDIYWINRTFEELCQE